MAQNRLTMTFLFCPPYDIIIWAGQDLHSQPSRVTLEAVPSRTLTKQLFYAIIGN